MKSRSAPLVLAALLLFSAGVVSHIAFQSFTRSDDSAEPLVAKAPDTEIARLAEQIAALQRENAILENRLDQSEIPEPAPRAEIATAREPQSIATSTQAISLNSERFREMMARQVNQQLDIYSARLNLTEGQREKLEEIMLMRMLQFRARFGPNGPEAARSGTDTPLITQRDIDDLAAEILDDSQLDEYNEMRAQEDASRSEMMATAQLSQIAPQLGLSEAQKDEVFTIFYNQSMEMTSERPNQEAMQEARKRADEQIVELLDETQRKVFETLRQNDSFGNFTVYAR